MNARDGIAASNARLCEAFGAGDMEGVAGCYVEDAWFMVPGMDTLKGRTAIAAGFGGLRESGVSGLELTTDEVFETGELAVEVGGYRLFAGETEVDRGRFLVTWKKSGDNWLLHRDMINSLNPPG